MTIPEIARLNGIPEQTVRAAVIRLGYKREGRDYQVPARRVPAVLAEIKPRGRPRKVKSESR